MGGGRGVGGGGGGRGGRASRGFANAALNFREGHGGLRGAGAELPGEREGFERGLPFKRGGTHGLAGFEVSMRSKSTSRRASGWAREDLAISCPRPNQKTPFFRLAPPRCSHSRTPAGRPPSRRG